MDDRRLAKGQRWFEYHCYEGEDSSDGELWHHTHQQVEVVARLNGTELPMYKAKFKDGLECDVFGDELMDSPKDFYRLNYVRLKL